MICSMPRFNGISTGRSRARVADLAASRIALVVVCKRCRHEAVLFPHRLVELGADRLAVAELPRRLRCRECRTRGEVQIRNPRADAAGRDVKPLI